MLAQVCGGRHGSGGAHRGVQCAGPCKHGMGILNREFFGCAATRMVGDGGGAALVRVQFTEPCQHHVMIRDINYN